MSDERNADESEECTGAPEETPENPRRDTHAYARDEARLEVAFSRAQALLDALRSPGASPAAAMTEDEMSRTLRDGMVAAAMLGRRLRS